MAAWSNDAIHLGLSSHPVVPTTQENTAPSAIDLFCGAGGLSLGLTRAGVRVLRGYDQWAPATATHRANFAHEVEEAAITPDLDLPPADLVVGGPPCQGFSSAGLRREGDGRNSLVRTFSSLVARHRPSAFLFENVEGFLTAGDGAFVFDLLEPLIEAGYWVHLRKVSAASFGVPQHRKRVIAIGGLGWDPGFAHPSHRAYGAPGAPLGTHAALPLAPAINDALAGLPAAIEQKIAASDEFDHRFTPLNSADAARARLLRPGQCMKDLPEDLWHGTYRRRAFRRVMDGTPSERRGGPPSGLRRLDGSAPSKAITAGAISEFLHPAEDRRLTIRECARLQTFPDSFAFCGSRRDRAQLIGNAVPPLFAERLAGHLLPQIRRASPAQGNGKLLSFVPTLSDGMSPALRSLSNRVEERFLCEGVGEQLSLWP